MALGQVGWSALLITCSGLIAFILGISAENQKPTAIRVSGLTASGGDTAVTCVYPADPTIWLGSIAVVLLFVTAFEGLVAIVFPYQGKRVPVRALFKSTSLLTFTILSIVIFLVAEALLLWATILESLHRRQFNGKVDPTGSCPTAKTGLFGGAAFLALDSTLFWLICLMLTVNARADHFNSFEEEDMKEATQMWLTRRSMPLLLVRMQRPECDSYQMLGYSAFLLQTALILSCVLILLLHTPTLLCATGYV